MTHTQPRNHRGGNIHSVTQECRRNLQRHILSQLPHELIARPELQPNNKVTHWSRTCIHRTPNIVQQQQQRQADNRRGLRASRMGRKKNRKSARRPGKRRRANAKGTERASQQQSIERQIDGWQDPRWAQIAASPPHGKPLAKTRWPIRIERPLAARAQAQYESLIFGRTCPRGDAVELIGEGGAEECRTGESGTALAR